MRRFIQAAALILAASWAAPGVAQQSRDQEARAEFEQGIEAAHRAELVRARQHFQRSLSVLPRPATAFNLALVLRRMGEYIEAEAVLAALIRDEHGQLSEPERDGAEELQGTIAALVATVRIRVESASAVEVRVDGRLHESGEGLSSVVLRLNPGPHTVHISNAGSRVFEQDLELEEGSTETLVADLGQADSPGEEPRRSLARSPWVWIIAGVALVGLGVGLGVGLSGRSEELPADLPFGRVEALHSR